MSDSDPTRMFVEELSTSLGGDRAWKKETIAEIRGHLLDAVGDTPHDLATFEDIVERFGEPARLAAALNRQYALAGIRTQIARAGRLSVIAATLTMIVAVAAVSWSDPSPPEPGGLQPDTVVLARGALRVERPQVTSGAARIDGGLLGLSR